MSFEKPQQSESRQYLEQKERKQALREEVAENHKKLARFQIVFRNEVMRNPDIDPEKLRKIMREELGDGPSFTNWDLYFDSVIDEYSRRRAMVKELRKEYPNDFDLFNAVFSFIPRDTIEIDQGPATLYFKCYGNQDYLDAVVGTYTRHLDSNTISDQYEGLNLSAGAMVSDSQLSSPDLYGIALIENSGHKWLREEDSSNNTKRHEELHAWNSLFEELGVSLDLEILKERIKPAENATGEDYEKLFENFIAGSGAYNLAKDEIFAHYNEHGNPAYTIRVLKESPLYSYLGNTREALIKEADNWPEFQRAPYLTAIENVFLIKYGKNIENAVLALDTLVKEFNLSPIEAISLVRFKEIAEWPELVSGYREAHEGKAYREYRQAEDENAEKLEKFSKQGAETR